MAEDEVQLDGDPRNLARAILRAARETYREARGNLEDLDSLRSSLKEEVPKLSKEMVEALEPGVRDVYLMNALEIMAMTYARREARG